MVELRKFQVGALDFYVVAIRFDTEYLVVVRLIDALTLYLAVFFLLKPT